MNKEQFINFIKVDLNGTIPDISIRKELLENKFTLLGLSIENGYKATKFYYNELCNAKNGLESVYKGKVILKDNYFAIVDNYSCYFKINIDSFEKLRPLFQPSSYKDVVRHILVGKNPFGTDIPSALSDIEEYYKKSDDKKKIIEYIEYEWLPIAKDPNRIKNPLHSPIHDKKYEVIEKWLIEKKENINTPQKMNNQYKDKISPIEYMNFKKSSFNSKLKSNKFSTEKSEELYQLIIDIIEQIKETRLDRDLTIDIIEQQLNKISTCDRQFVEDWLAKALQNDDSYYYGYVSLAQTMNRKNGFVSFNFEILSDIEIYRLIEQEKIENSLNQKNNILDEKNILQQPKKQSQFSVLEWATIFYYADESKLLPEERIKTKRMEQFMSKHNFKTTTANFKTKYYDATKRINNKSDFPIDKLNLIIPFLKENYKQTITKVQNDIEILENNLSD